MIGGAALPLHQEQGRVVGGHAAPGSRQGVRQGPNYLLHAASSVVGVLHEADKALLAELLLAGPVLLDDTVGEEQHPVTAAELFLADVRCGTADPDRKGSRALQRPADPVAADQQWRRVTDVDPLQAAGGDIQAHHLRRDELVRPELLVDGGVRQPADRTSERLVVSKVIPCVCGDDVEAQ
jgi:hypothetical protein